MNINVKLSERTCTLFIEGDVNTLTAPELDNAIEENLGNENKIADILTKDLINKMTLISPIPQQNLPQKKKIIENLKQEKEESFEEKDEEDLTPDYDEEEEEESDDSYIENLNPKKESKNDKNALDVIFALESYYDCK